MVTFSGEDRRGVKLMVLVGCATSGPVSTWSDQIVLDADPCSGSQPPIRLTSLVVAHDAADVCVHCLTAHVESLTLHEMVVASS